MSVNASGPAGAIMAVKQLQQQKIEGSINNQLIQAAGQAADQARGNPFGNVQVYA